MPAPDCLSRPVLAASFAAACALTFACSGPPDRPAAGGAADADTAEVVLALGATPANVKCVVITIATDKAEKRPFDLAPGQPAKLLLSKLPVGVVVFAADAYLTSCSAVTAATVPAFTGGPVSATLTRGNNGTITIVMQANSQASVELVFDPSAPPTCAPGGNACAKDRDCCSGYCSFANAATVIGTCRADQAPAATGGTLVHKPEELTPLGGKATYPAFDGDSFYVSFPDRSDPSNDDQKAEGVRARYLEPALRAIGFRRLDRLLTPESEPRVLPGGNFDQLVGSSCDRLADDERATFARDVCAYLRSLSSAEQPGVVADAGANDASAAFLPGPASRFVQQALGVTGPALRAAVNRPLHYWAFSQRERGVPIEHKGVMVLRGDRRSVTAVYGSVINDYVITNDVGLNGPTALARGLANLFRIEGLAEGPPRKGPTRTDLVLLPYGSPPGVPDGKVIALRFAYRAAVSTVRVSGPRKGEVVAFNIWIDALTGDLLKYVAESNDAAKIGFFRPWCRDPSTSTCGPFPVFVDQAQSHLPTLSYDLGNATFKFLGPANAPPDQVNPDSGAPMGTTSQFFVKSPPGNFTTEPCSADGRFRAAAAAGHLEYAYGMFKNGGRLFDLADITIFVDAPGVQNAANYGSRSLTFILGGLPTATTPGPLCPDGDTIMAGAQDATIVAHELGHLVTMHLQNGREPTECGPDGCPALDPYNRRFFHDYSDGIAAMITESPCIGGWAGKNRRRMKNGTMSKRPIEACANPDEGFELPRLVFADDHPERAFANAAEFLSHVPDDFKVPDDPAVPADQKVFAPHRRDQFPNHRVDAAGEYGDGQILGAAFWHLYQGVRSQGSVAGTAALWSRINTSIFAAGYTQTVNPVASERSSLNVYRAGRELLLQLTGAWFADGGAQTVNKLLSAFARAGFFLTPSACLDGAAGSPTIPDEASCPGGLRSGADAIVDVYDGDPTDGDTRAGTLLADDDNVHVTAQRPTFRVWTGVPFRFAPAAEGGAAIPTTDMCNDHFQVEVRRVATPGATPSVVRSSESLPTTRDCYGEWSIEAGPWGDLLAGPPPPDGKIILEYKVRTYRESRDPMGQRTESNRRDSIEPANGLWPGATGAGRPSVFFVTVDGGPG